MQSISEGTYLTKPYFTERNSDNNPKDCHEQFRKIKNSCEAPFVASEEQEFLQICKTILQIRFSYMRPYTGTKQKLKITLLTAINQFPCRILKF
jgi:hypothetical protein